MTVVWRWLSRWEHVRRWHWPRGWLRRGALGLLAAALVALYIWAAIIGHAPARVASNYVPLDWVGYPGVLLKVVHPAYVGPRDTDAAAQPITLIARASSAEQAVPLTLVITLPDDALSLVDRSGAHVAGQVTITPGFPGEAPHDVWLAHGGTQVGMRLLGSHHVPITLAMVTGDKVVTISDLTFLVAADSAARQQFRRVARVGTIVLPLVVLIVALAVFALSRWHQRQHHAHLTQERLLAGRYAQLRSHIKLEQWTEARQELESIQSLQPAYRDVAQLDSLVSSAESASWRREQLYSSGLEAYRRRDWAAAAQAFATLEDETPYYREVRFLRRTAALYADLRSRDRSMRVEAARQLGQVGDLVDTTPLIDALGDRSALVADAAEEALRQIGASVADDLIGALKHPSGAVRGRAFHLLQQMGRAVHERLLAGLHSNDVQVTRGVARLLAHMGAREELARALLWIEPQHHDSVGRALARESVAAVPVLTDVLFEAPPERRQGIINVFASLLDQEEVQVRVAEVLRATRDPRHRALLQRVLRAAGGQTVADAAEHEGDSAPTSGSALRWLRRIDKGQ